MLIKSCLCGVFSDQFYFGFSNKSDKKTFHFLIRLHLSGGKNTLESCLGLAIAPNAGRVVGRVVHLDVVLVVGRVVVCTRDVHGQTMLSIQLMYFDTFV